MACGVSSRRTGISSPWSGNERVRIGERFHASLAGIVELDLLKSVHRELVETALRQTDDQHEGHKRQPLRDQISSQDCSGCYLDGLKDRKLDRSQSQDLLDEPEKGRLRQTLSSFSSEHLELDQRCHLHNDSVTTAFPGDSQLDSDSRPSSGFYSVSGSSLSNSCTSVFSEGPAGSGWNVQSRPRSTDDSATQGSEFRLQEQGGLAGSREAKRPVSAGDLDLFYGFISIAELCPPARSVATAAVACVSISSTVQPQLSLDPKYRSDLISRNTNEIYHYPSPLHAVALQSPLYTTVSENSGESKEDLNEDKSVNTSVATITPVLPMKEHETDSILRSTNLSGNSSILASPGLSCPSEVSKMEKYISKLVVRYRCRSATTPFNLKNGIPKQEVDPSMVSHQKSLSMSSICSGSTSSTMVGGTINSVSSLNSVNSVQNVNVSANIAWKGRRRISTCCMVKSPEGPGTEGLRTSPGFQESWRNSNSPSNRSSVISLSFDESAVNWGSKRSSVNNASKPEDFYCHTPGLMPGVDLLKERDEEYECDKENVAWEWNKLPKHLQENCTSDGNFQYSRPFYKRATSLRWTSSDTEQLYQGKHASKELVKASTISGLNGMYGVDCYLTERQTPVLLTNKTTASGSMSSKNGPITSNSKRKISFRKRLEALVMGKRSSSGSRSSSEMHLNSFSGKENKKKSQLFRSESHNALVNSRKQRWMSVMEISSHATGEGDCMRRHRDQLFQDTRKYPSRIGLISNQRGAFCQDARFVIDSSQMDLASGCLFQGSQASLCSINGEYWGVLHLRPDYESRVSDEESETRLYRTKSFRELRKKVFSSMRPFSFKSQSLRK
ncbi:uncharacterized protein si:ch211-168f7.5 [Polypterus senegalus]|uniref:uncharacterized protein si:ch211-168f7.5 n=1 Tax=Polypterus senegalus TaxID=55291 RepID=UPI0019626CAF|nr:uncharacterized protein si:ch211-168f7.5 [Polypterus senegalus]